MIIIKLLKVKKGQTLKCECQNFKDLAMMEKRSGLFEVVKNEDY